MTDTTEPTLARADRRIAGLHHVSAIATDPQQNLELYAGLLGLKLVKRTVNFDDPSTYHLYYGDETGSPGTLMTFFPIPRARRGSRGTGQATTTAFAVPTGSLGWWRDRLAAASVVHEDPAGRLDEEALVFLDGDGLRLELVEDPTARDRAPWSTAAGSPVPETHALRGFHSVALTVAQEAPSRRVLEGMGYRHQTTEGARHRFVAGGAEADTAGATIDLVVSPGAGDGRGGAGTVHHIAFRAADDTDQLAWRDAVIDLGLQPTEVLDRQYFHSIYFREPGGVLYEIATDPPGMTFDETVPELGTALKLPPWLEGQRRRIEDRLPGLQDPTRNDPTRKEPSREVAS
jgi:glyoxalase family protein